MSDVVLLRKLSRKSTMKFGQYEELTVQDIINLTKHKYLRWVYFNCSNIDFMDDVLDEIRIPENFRIKKPIKKPELHDELNKLIFENLDSDFVEKYLKNKNKIAEKTLKGKSVSNKVKDCLNYSNSALQRLNHGH
jgi:hypothetical protein